MKITVFAGDLADVRADALCTSTNPRLSLVMGTGASIRARGGPEILAACRAIVDAESRRSANPGLPPGSVHATTAGSLPSRVILHCVASDAEHRSSPDIIRLCTLKALAMADAAGCTTIAMPLFATGHARFGFDRALQAMAETLRDATTAIQQVFIVVRDRDRAEGVVKLIRSVIPAAPVELLQGPRAAEERTSMWSDPDDL